VCSNFVRLHIAADPRPAKPTPLPPFAGIIHAIWVVLNHRSIRPVEQLEDATEALIPDL
jgi:hypothetical protein